MTTYRSCAEPGGAEVLQLVDAREHESAVDGLRLQILYLHHLQAARLVDGASRFIVQNESRRLDRLGPGSVPQCSPTYAGWMAKTLARAAALSLYQRASISV